MKAKDYISKQERRFLNFNFVIRIYMGGGVSLVGGGQLYRYMPEEVFRSEFKKLKTLQKDKHTYWDRGLLKIEFISK